MLLDRDARRGPPNGVVETGRSEVAGARGGVEASVALAPPLLLDWTTFPAHVDGEDPTLNGLGGGNGLPAEDALATGVLAGAGVESFTGASSGMESCAGWRSFSRILPRLGPQAGTNGFAAGFGFPSAVWSGGDGVVILGGGVA
jgi:hypothetical protein